MNKLKRYIGLAAVLGLTACTPAQAIQIHFGDSPTARRVAQCESKMDPGAVSPTNDHGLFQINSPTWNKPGHSDPVADSIGGNWDKRYDPLWNSWFAKQIVDKYGWTMWSCY